MILIRKTLAIGAMVALGGLIVTLERGAYGVNPGLVVAACCVLFIPAGAFFVWRESSWAGGARVFAASFLPGVLAGWACLIVFGKPVWKSLRPE